MFETERLRIRNFKPDDSKSCFESWGKDINLGKYIILYPMKDVSQMDSLVRSLVNNENAWLLQEKETGNVIGYITVDIPFDILKIGELGYVIAEKYHHCGYAYEALSYILKKYLYEKDLYLLEAKYNENNVASSNLLHKLGFQIEASLRDRRIDRLTGKRNNMIVCSITKDEVRF
jgi:RimJ/RimL family protein N-acetyltransferase